MRIIDFHTHLDTHWFNQPMPSEAEFLRGLDRFEIEAACIFTLQGFYGDCRKHNDALAARARRHPDRLIPFATVDPKLGDEAVDELERCLADPLFRGVKFHPWLQAFAPSMVRSTMIELLRMRGSTSRARVIPRWHSALFDDVSNRRSRPLGAAGDGRAGSRGIVGLHRRPPVNWCETFRISMPAFAVRGPGTCLTWCRPPALTK